MTEDPVGSAFTTSNATIITIIISEALFLGLIIFGNSMDSVGICGGILLIFSAFVVLFIIGIVLAVKMINSGKHDKKNSSTWTGAGILVIIGLVLIIFGAPIFPLFIVIGLYIMTFPYLDPRGKGLLTTSIIIYFIGLTGSFIVIFLKGAVPDLAFFIAGGISLFLLLVSHGIHIFINTLALTEYRTRERIPDLGAVSQITDRHTMKRQEVREKIEVPPEYSSWKEPVVKIEEPFEGPGTDPIDTRRPRELRPPPGFSLP